MRTTRMFTAVAAGAALVLFGCADNDNDNVAEPDTPVEEADEPDDVEDGTADADDADDTGGEDTDTTDGDDTTDEDVAMFDPNKTVHLVDIEATPAGSNTIERPFGDLPGTINFEVPAAVQPVIWTNADDEGGWVSDRGHSRSSYVQLSVPGATLDDLTTFVDDQLTEHGWETTDNDTQWFLRADLERGPDSFDNADDAGWGSDTTLTITYNENQDPIWLNVEVTVDPTFVG